MPGSPTGPCCSLAPSAPSYLVPRALRWLLPAHARHPGCQVTQAGSHAPRGREEVDGDQARGLLQLLVPSLVVVAFVLSVSQRMAVRGVWAGGHWHTRVSAGSQACVPVPASCLSVCPSYPSVLPSLLPLGLPLRRLSFRCTPAPILGPSLGP